MKKRILLFAVCLLIYPQAWGGTLRGKDAQDICREYGICETLYLTWQLEYGPRYMIIEITNRDYWFKVVGMLQQNWAIIEKHDNGDSCTVFFISDGSRVFDKIVFSSSIDARVGLKQNGFRLYSENYLQVQKFLTPPPPPFHDPRCNVGPYSSGEYWR